MPRSAHDRSAGTTGGARDAGRQRDLHGVPSGGRRGKPPVRPAAAAGLGEPPVGPASPGFAGRRAHDYPLVRYFAQRALETLTGAPVVIDVGAPAADVRRAAADWLRAAAARR